MTTTTMPALQASRITPLRAVSDAARMTMALAPLTIMSWIWAACSDAELLALTTGASRIKPSFCAWTAISCQLRTITLRKSLPA
ncbi:hypothetical protein D3C76_1542150 [compost metagenome]